MLTHIDGKGQAEMVDVSEKSITTRRARAAGIVYVLPATLDAITENSLPKGEAFSVARIAGIMAAKRCDQLIPLCHSLPLSNISVYFETYTDPARVEIMSEVACEARTGAEMEALMAVTIAALTIYDMVKAIDREARIGDIHLVEKSGGKSGHFVAEAEKCKEK